MKHKQKDYALSHLDLVLYQAVCKFEDAWTPNEPGTIDGKIFSERERKSLCSILKRWLDREFDIVRVIVPEHGPMGKKIRDARVSMGLRQLDLCDKIRVSPDALIQWEKGRREPDEKNKAKLEEVLGIEL